MSEENKTTLTDEQLDKVCETAATCRIPDNDIEYRPEDNNITEEITDTNIDNINNLDSMYDNEDFIKIFDVVKHLDDPNYKVYKNLPACFQDTVRNIATEQNISIEHWEDVAREFASKFKDYANADDEFDKLQKELSEALKVPSVMDIYNEHTEEVMNKNIPELIEKLKDSDPDKADQLAKVKEMYTKAFDFSIAREKYDNNSRIRKAIRRYNNDFNSKIDYYNSRVLHTDFKMHNAMDAYNALVSALANHTNHNYTEVDAKKFMIYILASTEDLDFANIADESYAYYLIKNIAMLKYLGEGLTDFSSQLISNICDNIEYITNKEDESNASLQNKSKSGCCRN